MQCCSVCIKEIIRAMLAGCMCDRTVWDSHSPAVMTWPFLKTCAVLKSSVKPKLVTVHGLAWCHRYFLIITKFRTQDI